MTLINKNDVNQIFAINAPAQDKPASFANYPNGWDAARSNNGRPTIRQFNFLQQRTDQNILWIHQNGAALPYDSNIEYADGAVVVKDGELQKKSGSNWGAIGGSGYGQKWKSNPNGYALNDRVMLDSGDIVRSTIANNTKNPNVDMTGWVNTSNNISIVKTINDLIVISNPKDGDVVCVKSYHTPTNFALAHPYRGGGDFVYRYDLSEINNGVTIFNGWVRNLNDKILTTEDAGLTGVVATDGDSTAKLQALASACSDGFTVKFIGEFKVSTSVQFSNRANLNIQHIKISPTDKLYGDASSWKFNTGTNIRGILQLNECIKPVISDLYVKGVNLKRTGTTPASGIDSTEDGDAGIFLRGCHGAVVQRCTTTDVITWGIGAIDSNDVTAVENKIYRCLKQSGINISWAAARGTIISGAKILRNYIEDCGLAGIEIEGQDALKNVYAADNVILNCRVGVNITPHPDTNSTEISSVTLHNNKVYNADYGILFNADNGLTDYQFAGNELFNTRVAFGIATSSKYRITGDNFCDSKGVDGTLLIRRSAHDNILSIINTTQFFVNNKQNSLTNVVAGSTLYFGDDTTGYTVASIEVVPITDWMNPVNSSSTQLFKVTMNAPLPASAIEGAKILYSKPTSSYVTYISTNAKNNYDGFISGNTFRNFTHGIRGAETTFTAKSHEITGNRFIHCDYYVYNEYAASTGWFVHDNTVCGDSTESKCFQIGTMLTAGSLVPNGVRTVRLSAQGESGYVWLPRNVQTIQARARIFGGSMGATTSTVIALQFDGTGVGNKTITTLASPSIHEWQIDPSYSGLSDFGQMAVRIIFGAGDVTFSYAEVELFYI